MDLCGFVWILCGFCVDLCGFCVEFVWMCVDLCGFVWRCKIFIHQNGVQKRIFDLKNKNRFLEIFLEMAHTNSGSSIRKKTQNRIIPSVLKENTLFGKKNRKNQRINPTFKIT